jgi:hypothetical protein
VAQAVECLFCECEALSLNLNPTIKKKKKKYKQGIKRKQEVNTLERAPESLKIKEQKTDL